MSVNRFLSNRHFPKPNFLILWGALLHISKRNTTNMTAITYEDMRHFACKMFGAGVDAVQPSTLVEKTLRMEGKFLSVAEKRFELKKPCTVIGFGKAALGMAVEVEKLLGLNMSTGIISVPKGTQSIFQAPPNTRLNIFEGADNNLPDEAAMKTATHILDVARSLTHDDLMLVLISGGGSALLPLPRPPVSLEEKLWTIKLLTSAGANIHQLNCVRKTLSQVKGGQLAAAAYPASTVSLILSDVIGDPIDIIASGPTVPNNQPTSAARDVISLFKLESKVPKSVRDILFSEQVPQSHQKFLADNFVIGSNRLALAAVKKEAEEHGFEAVALSSSVEGFITDIAQFYANLTDIICSILSGMKNIDNLVKFLMDSSSQIIFFPSLITDLVQAVKHMPNKKGLCIIAGGETTVHVTGQGLGGRNQELALLYAEKISILQKSSLHMNNFRAGLLSAGTDGIDGPTSAAGAFGCEDQVECNPDYKIFLKNNDTHTFYQQYCNGKYIIKTGHTGTNVMDIHILVVQRL